MFKDMSEGKKRVLKRVRNIALSVVVLLFVFVGGGVGYIWYTGQNTDANSAALAEPVEYTPVARESKPRKSNPNAPVGASVQMLTSPVAPGSNASVSVKTNPDVKCTIKVEYNKVASTDSGLIPKQADEYGLVSWTWTVEESVPLGKWPVEITCGQTDKTAFVRGELEVAKLQSQ